MVQSTKDAALKGAQMKLSKEECALGMVLRSNANDAATKDAQISFRREGYVGDTAQRRNGAH